MLGFLTILLLCQLVGTAIQDASGMPIPGPVIGMFLLFVGLLIRGKVPDELSRVSRGLLDNLSLLFVPAGVGIMQQWTLIGQEWMPISVSVIGSTLITIAITALAMQWLDRLRSRSEAMEKSEP